MSTIDRRSGEDRRSVKRRNITLDVEWEGAEGRRSGTLSDLSEAGCFVLTGGEVSEGDTIKLPQTGRNPEVERVLSEHPGVLEVAVIGVPDER